MCFPLTVCFISLFAVQAGLWERVRTLGFNLGRRKTGNSSGFSVHWALVRFLWWAYFHRRWIWIRCPLGHKVLLCWADLEMQHKYSFVTPLVIGMRPQVNVFWKKDYFVWFFILLSNQRRRWNYLIQADDCDNYLSQLMGRKLGRDEVRWEKEEHSADASVKKIEGHLREVSFYDMSSYFSSYSSEDVQYSKIYSQFSKIFEPYCCYFFYCTVYQ